MTFLSYAIAAVNALLMWSLFVAAVRLGLEMKRRPDVPEYFDCKRMAWVPVRRFRFRACDGSIVVVWAQNEIKAVATFQDSHEYEHRGWYHGMFYMDELPATADEECSGI